MSENKNISTQSKPRVIISGGGTGGHVFPAIAIADAIKVLRPNAEILFVGAKGKIEMEKVPEAGYKIEGLTIAGIQRKLTTKNLSFPFKLFKSLGRCRSILKSFKPDMAIGVGGYASGPLLFMAGNTGVPVFIQEQNSYPGITNRILSRYAKKIFVAYEGMGKLLPKENIVLSGNPVRKDIAQVKDQGESRQAFGLEPDKTTLLIVGGSQGARSINKAIEAGLDELITNNVQVIWQTGKGYQSAHASDKKGCSRNEFIRNMAEAYSAADVVLARSGASTVSELGVVGKPAIFVPFPHAAEDHQTSNAKAMVDKEAALLIKDNDAGKELIKTALALLNDKNKRTAMAAQMKKLGIENAADRIARETLEIIGK
ncbi:MAG: UDP-N-acetylglucosamine--N-acetylmuramyl-(pentapeptide) pyrophosphoryl-undecaprenol N-acetylglucosamine transferase [Sphingobacteriales bacterium]|jgi:UDP-N-acetylglucosamine--N-acetylmuramyl-(pentapeptide) pyrophosphoryl-undecaprenol N-acetylglucosamine transferase